MLCFSAFLRLALGASYTSTMASNQHLKIQTAELLIGYALAPASCPIFLEYPKMVLFCLDVEVLPITVRRGTRWGFTGIIDRAVICLNSHRRSRVGVIIILSREGSWETANWKYGKAKGGRVHSLSFFKVFLFIIFWQRECRRRRPLRGSRRCFGLVAGRLAPFLYLTPRSNTVPRYACVRLCYDELASSR